MIAPAAGTGPVLVNYKTDQTAILIMKIAVPNDRAFSPS